jgi:hypothetical protein
MNRFRVKIRPARFRRGKSILLSRKGLAAEHIIPIHDLHHLSLFKTGHNPLSNGTILV